MTSRLAANISSLLASEIVRRLLGFLSVAVLARTVGVEGFGIVMIGMTVLSYVSLAGSAGLHVLGTRNVARGDVDIDPGAVIGTRILNTAAAVIVANAIVAFTVSDVRLQEVILITSLSGFLHALFLEWYFHGKERMGEAALARTIGAAIYLMVLTLGVHSPGDLRRAAIAAVIGDFASTGYLLARFRLTVGTLRIRFSPKMWSGLMRKAFPFGAGSVLGHLSVNLPVLVVGALLGASSAGIYSGASKLVFFLLMADRILGTILLPASVRLHTNAPGQFHEALQKTMRWILLFGLPLGVGGTLLGPRLVSFVLGPGFEASGPVFGILIWYVVLTMVHTVYTSVVMATGGEQEYRNVMVASAFLYAVFVTVGAWQWGVHGTAAGALLAEGITVIRMARAARRSVERFSVTGLLRIVMASIACGCAVMFLDSQPLVLAIVAGALVYAGASVGLRTVGVEDFREMVRQTRVS